MSLTSFLKNKDVKERFALEFPTLKFNLSGELKAQPKTNNYALVGTAFDYLMRFYLKRINPSATTQEWVAECATELINDRKTSKKVKEILLNAKKSYSDYLKTGELNDELIKYCIYLAQIESIYRAGIIDPKIGTADPLDVDDMRNLIKLIDPKEFRCKTCMLNPTFGEASTLVGGADMDVLIDSTLIDIKTTKYLELNRDHYNQIIGYYILSLIGGIDNAPKGTKVEFVGIYYSRHGLLFKVAINEIVKTCDAKKFITWFKKRAKQDFQ